MLFKTHKPYNISDQPGQTLYPISDQSVSKTIPFCTAQTCLAYIREYPQPPTPNPLWSQGDKANTISPAQNL